MEKNFNTILKPSKKHSLKEQKNYNSDTKLMLPSISSKIGSLRTFLSVEDFRKSIQTVSEESKQHTDIILRRKIHKIYITMNEELSSSTKKEISGKLNGGQEEQGESVDERKKLLYDKHIINRQKAAVNICKMIVDEVKQKFGHVDPAEDSDEKSNSSVNSEIDFKLDIEELKEKTKNCTGLIEELDKISEISQNFFKRTSGNESNKKKINFKNELIPGEIEETASHESNIHRISKSKEKNMREDILMQIGELYELLPDIPHFSVAHKITYNSILQQLPKLPIIDNPQVYYSYISQKLEIASSLLKKSSKLKKTFISINRNCISLPDLRLDSHIGLYIIQYFTAYRSLLRVDMSGNPIGDRIGALLVHCLNSFSEGLEYLDLSATGISLYTSQALQKMLQNSLLRLQYLKIESNLIQDEGLCCICVGLLSNNTLLFLNVGDNQIDISGGYALSKVIRINRGLKGINISKSCIKGKPLREICRSLIVNNEIISINLSSCQIDDEDTKEIGHLLNANNHIQQVYLSQNNISQKGLDYLKYGLPKNKSLIHLALSGNKNIKLAGLEKIKDSMPKTFEIDIGKEADFFKTIEAKKYKLIEYIR